MRASRKFLGALFTLIGSIHIAGSSVLAGEIWEGPAFSADPAAVLEGATAVPASEGADVMVLFEQEHILFDAQGRKNYTRYFVFRVITPAGAENWSTVGAEWEPWHQQRPVIRARVITPDRAVHALDEKTLGDAPAASDQQDVFTDRRILRGPLPAVAVGAVVEEEVAIQDTAPLFDRGIVHHDFFGKNVPVHRTRLVVEGPAAVPLHYVVRLLPSVQPFRTESGGHVRLTFQSGPLGPIQSGEPDMPGDLPRWPHVAISTGKSWKEVASRYSEAVDEQVRDADLKGLVEPVKKFHPGRAQVITALVEKIHTEVRYTGVEFGQASLVPGSPGETLKRKYGDCKDKAALLVAMLRAAGMPAYVVLLTTAPGEDVEPDLPGMGAFDHAIVYTPGSPDFWIDPTGPYARIGQLPIVDQGRLCLIASPGTNGLIRTPESTSRENRTVETREFFLAELGKARVVETSESWGSIEEQYRRDLGAPDLTQVHKQIEDYAKSAYAAEKLAKFERTDAKDFSVPFRMRLEADHASRGTTSLEEAAVGIFMGGLVGRLPAYLLKEESGEKDESSGASSGNSQAARKNDLVLMEPHVVEWRYRIIPPPGFKPGPLPESGKQNLGPALLTKEFKAEAGGVVTATLRFDTVQRRFTAEQATALQAGVVQLRKADPILVTYEQTGEAYLAGGKIREALAEFRTQTAAHPQEALHHTRIARALLAAGIGEGARAEAQQAVKLEATSALAHSTFGWTLEHDLIGRRLAKGSDPAGAEAAYHQAIKLDPNDGTIQGSLAILLEHNAQGVRYGPGSRLDEAITIYRALQEKLGENTLSDNLLFALLWAKRFKDLKESAEKLSASPTRQALLLAATAAGEGSAKAIRDAPKKIPGEEARRKALVESGQLLLQVRFYSEAADLFTAGAQNTPEAAETLSRAAVIRNARRYEDLALPENDPKAVVRKLFILLISSQLEEKEILKLISRHSAGEAKSDEFGDLQKTMRATRQQLARLGIPLEVALDLGLANLTLSSEGDDSFGYRVRAQGLGVSSQRNTVFFVVREEGQYRILDMGTNPTSLGAEVLDRLEKGDLDRARRWLDWAREEQELAGGEDPLAGSAFPRFWEKGKPGDADAIRYAAASLLARGNKDEATRAVEVLRQGLEKASAEEARIRFDLALAPAFAKLKKYEDLLTLARHLIDASPDSRTAFGILFAALVGLKRWPDCEKAAADRLKRLPDDMTALRSLAQVASFQGQIKKAQDLELGIIKRGKAEPVDFNEFAWDGLVRGEVTEEIIQAAQRAVILSQNQNGAALHTLAALYAEADRTSEAREVLLKSMEVRGLEEPDDITWYVFGRIAEQFRVTEAAKSAYRRLQSPDSPEALPTSTYLLAQRRLKTLEAGAQ